MNEPYPDVLVGTPIYDKKDYCRKEFVQNIEQLDYPGRWRWLLVDNSKGDGYYKKLRRAYPFKVAHVKRGENTRDAIRNAMNYLREKTLKGGYEYLMVVESDLFPPKDTIRRLMRHGKSVCGLPYEIGFGKNRGLCVFILDKKDTGMGTRRLTVEESKTFLDGSLKQVHGMGVGCVLIHKSILEKYPFWYSSADDKRMKGLPIRKHPDVYFYLELHNDGILVYLDTSVHVRHENSDWAKVKDV